MKTIAIMMLLLAVLLLPSCKHLDPPSNTPAAAQPETLGGIPSHRY